MERWKDGNIIYIMERWKCIMERWKDEQRKMEKWKDGKMKRSYIGKQIEIYTYRKIDIDRKIDRKKVRKIIKSKLYQI